MPALSTFKSTATTEPPETKFAVARIVYAIEARQALGFSFANSRDYVLAHQVYRDEINTATDGGWLVRNPTLTFDATGLATA